MSSKDDQTPIIGINGMRWPDGAEEMFIMDKTQIHYIRAIQKSGGIPITLPVLEEFDPKAIRKQMGLIDGLLIQGGVDVDPSLFGEERKPELDITDIQTDKFILELIKIAGEKKIPIFGICKGIQILNIAYGGTLYQDLKYAGLKRQYRLVAWNIHYLPQFCQQRINRQHGTHIIGYAESIGLGVQKYNLVNIDQ